MVEEISSIRKNETWKLAPLPNSHKPIGLKWVYKLKKDTQGRIVKHILRYVKGTLNLGCVYEKKQGGLVLTGYSDSDLAGDTDDRKSTTGVIFFLGSNPVSWSSQK